MWFLRFLGYLLLLVYGLGVIPSSLIVNLDLNPILAIIITWPPTLLLALFGYRRCAREVEAATRRRKYVAIIRDGARSVQDVASVTGVPYDVVQKDLRAIAGKGDFKGAYFNEATQEIIFIRNVPAANWNNAPASPPAQPAASRNVCPACGASVGNGGKCEYCGSRLN